MMTFNDFGKTSNLQNKATSNIKIQHVFSSLSLIDVGIYLRDGPFSSDIRIVNLHHSKGTHWVCYINENFFDSYRCVCPKKLSKFIITRNRHRLYSEYQIQKMIVSVRVTAYIIYLTKKLGIVFKTGVLNLYYRTFC